MLSLNGRSGLMTKIKFKTKSEENIYKYASLESFNDAYKCDCIRGVYNNADNPDEYLQYTSSLYDNIILMLVKDDMIKEICNKDWTMDTINDLFEHRQDFISDRIKLYTGVNDEDSERYKRIFGWLKSDIEHINEYLQAENKDYTCRYFFNDKPIHIYQSEIESIKKISRTYRINERYGRRVVRLICLLLVWQKAYNNRFYNHIHTPYARLRSEDLYECNPIVEGTSSKRTDSTAMLADIRKLREDNHVSVILPEIYAPRDVDEIMPDLYYKVNFCVDESTANPEDIALTITDFEYMWEQIFVKAFKEFDVLQTPKDKEIKQGTIVDYDSAYGRYKVDVPGKKVYSLDSNKRYHIGDTVSIYIQDSKKGKITLYKGGQSERVYVTYKAVKRCSKCGELFYAKQMGNGSGNCEICNRR